MTDESQPESTGPEPDGAENIPEASSEIASEPASERRSEAEAGTVAEASPGAAESEEVEPEFVPQPRPPAKLERLQKILAQAGVASRRRAEELIVQGRVQVNGQIVTELGSKADAGRDHIRVDGKLLQGAERLRYFVLNKPKGFVTTVKDPEGRPTVMQFFEKMRERLYPVGRLDYQSEGLLLVTNDGELANRLTKAASGVEKTYLVKISGQPSEAELDRLRGGVAIERDKPGSPQVRTSPARIRQVRQGDNPWYEVVLIEGRNRELRKMFEEIGHFVEKIRRVGYGPLVLDQEPGHLRELDPEELAALRRAAEGKLRTPKSKEIRRRNLADAAQLPTVAPRPSRPSPSRPSPDRPAQERAPSASRPGEYRPKRSFGQGSPKPGKDKPYRPSRARGEDLRPQPGRPFALPQERPAAKPQFKRDDHPPRSPSQFAAGASREDRAGRDRGGPGKPGSGRPLAGKPAWKKPEKAAWPPYQRPPSERPAETAGDFSRKKPSRLHIEPVQHSDRPNRPDARRTGTDQSTPSRPGSGGRTSTGRSSFGRGDRPFRSQASLSRPFTTSSGKPRAGGARPSSKPPATGRNYGAGPKAGPRTGSGPRPSRPYTPRAEGASESRPRREGNFAGPPTGRGAAKSGSGWKPKPSFGAPGKPASGTHFKPKPGGFSKSAPKGKPSGKRPGGKKRG